MELTEFEPYEFPTFAKVFTSWGLGSGAVLPFSGEPGKEQPPQARRRAAASPAGPKGGKLLIQAKPAEMVAACVSTSAFGQGRKR